jgi:hypothetical protein
MTLPELQEEISIELEMMATTVLEAVSLLNKTYIMRQLRHCGKDRIRFLHK